MKIAPLSKRVFFEKRVIVKDAIGNESSQWQQLFSRWCSCKVLLETEGTTTVMVKNIHQLRFTLRYDSSIRELDSQTTRLRFEDKFYNIKAIDSLTYPQEIILIDATEEVQYGNN
nr:MAG TPA: Putative head tail adaptor [Caudoviricetes sp.]